MAKILFICNYYPNNYSGGSAINCFNYIQSVSRNNELFLYSIRDHESQGKKSDLQSLNIKVFDSTYLQTNKPNFFNFFSFKTTNQFKYKKLQQEGENLIKKIDPDIIKVYGEFSMNSLNYFNPKIVYHLIFGDPFHKVIMLRWRYNIFYNFKLKNIISYIGYTLHVIKEIIYFFHNLKGLDKKYDTLFYFGLQHKKTWIKLFKSKIKLLGSPIHRFNLGDEKLRLNKNKIIIIGKLGQIENLYAQHFFVRKLFPHLLKLKDNYEINFIGNKEGLIKPLKILSEKYPNKIKIRGFVNDINKEWKEAKILLVPTVTNLGVRTRIYSAFSLGCAVVCHVSSKSGIPELKNNFNCLIGNNAKEIAELLEKLLKDKKLRNKLINGGKQTLLNILQKTDGVVVQ